MPWNINTQVPMVGPWRGFLTRLCRTCEHREQQKVYEFINNPGSALSVANQNAHRTTKSAVGAPAEQPRTGWSPQWPMKSCTCASFLARTGPLPGAGGIFDDRWCWTHRAIAMDPLLARRDANDLWLRTTARDSQGRLCMASRKTMNKRNTVNVACFRACRCGGVRSIL